MELSRLKVLLNLAEEKNLKIETIVELKIFDNDVRKGIIS